MQVHCVTAAICVMAVALTVVDDNGTKGGALSAAQLGPTPGDVYREYATHNGGAKDWRVTDPAATARGANRFLPNPVLKIRIDDLTDAIRAEALLDRWGGHAGTKHKRILFNNNNWIRLPELTTTPQGTPPENYYSQDNPVVAVPLDHLKVGENTFAGGIGDENKSSWGQWGLYSLILRIYYDPAKKEHATGRIVTPTPGSSFGENPTIKLNCSSDTSRVDVLASYDGYDEDGDGVFSGWHQAYFQPSRGAAAVLQHHVGTHKTPPYELKWNTQFVPDQRPSEVQLAARIRNTAGVWWFAKVVDQLSLVRSDHSVKLYRAQDVPEHFAVRVDQTKSCRIPIPASDPLDRAENAVLHYCTWHGWDGHHAQLTLNEHAHANQGNNHHFDYDVIPIPVGQLKSGNNTFTIHSDTHHHMLEVLWPGPAITVRYRLR